MKTRTLLIGGLVALALGGILWYVLRQRATSSTVITGTPAGSGTSETGDILRGVGSIVGAVGSGIAGVLGSWRDKDDQKVDPEAGYTPTTNVLPNAGQLQF